MAEFRRLLTPVPEVWDWQMRGVRRGAAVPPQRDPEPTARQLPKVTQPSVAAEPTPSAVSDSIEDRGGYEHLHPLLVAYATTAADDPERARLRERLVTGYHPLAVNIARRYAHRGEPLDDLTQVASIGLMHSIDRFDPARGRHFLAFAVPTMTGEVRRHFRDRTWAMRVPRGLKELNSDINAAVRTLYQQLGRAPRPSEIAARLNVSTGAVLEALEAAHSYKSASLDKLLTPGAGTDAPGGTALGDLLGTTDPGFDVVTDTHAITGYVAALPPRERAILKMRFYDDMTQIQIAERIGVSQMHVSRLLAAVLARLRDSVLTDQPVPTGRPVPRGVTRPPPMTTPHG